MAVNENSIQNFTKSYNIAIISIIVFSLIGLAVAVYLFIVHHLPVLRNSLLFQICSVGVFNCDRVNSSRYSILFGYPIAGYGVLFYIIVFSLALLRQVVTQQKFIDVLMFVITAIGTLAVFPLFAISTFIIKAFCLYCVIAWICNFILFSAVLGLFIRNKQDSVKEIFREMAINFFDELKDFKKSIWVCIFVAVLFLLVLSAMFLSSRLFYLNKQYALLRENIQSQEEAYDRFIRLRPVRVDLSDTPVYYGNPSAKVSVVEFMNFDCGVCRKASPIIKSIIDKYPNKVKLFLKHYPLDGHCNKYIMAKSDGLSCRASLLAIALQRTAYYHDYVNHIMASKKHLSKELILDALQKVGVNSEKIKMFLDEKVAFKILEQHVESGAKFGVEGTPSFVINGKPIPTGLPPVQLLERIIKFEIDSVYGEK